MKICQVNPGCGIPVPPPNWGAIEKIVWELTQNLRKQGHEVDIKFANEIKPGEYDIVHVHVANLALNLRDRNIPYVFHLHDHHAYHWGTDSPLFEENSQAVASSLTSLLPAKYLVEYFNFPKAQYFSHGVNTKEFYPKNSAPPSSSSGPNYPYSMTELGWYHFHPKLLMIANNGLVNDPTFDRKGFKYGLGLAMMNDLEITIAGPSHNKKFFNENLWMLSYPKLNLVFDTPNDKLLELYHNHDVFVHPTMLEAGHPNLTMLEAAAAGLPIIADWELETDFHGAWRAPRDVFEMDRGLKNIGENWDWYKENVLNTAKELSWENRTKDLIQIYERFVN